MGVRDLCEFLVTTCVTVTTHPSVPGGARETRRYRGRVSDFLILAGLSGAGRSQAGDALEDLGWFVIDNLPSELIPKIAELVRSPGSPAVAGSRPSGRR